MKLAYHNIKKSASFYKKIDISTNETYNIKSKRIMLKSGDIIKIHYNLFINKTKQKLDEFECIVIGVQNRLTSKSFITHRIIENVGITQVFPVNTKSIISIKIIKRIKIKTKSKLYKLKQNKTNNLTNFV